MSKNSPIEWTDHTFNPWWGCAKVSPGCEHCYAESWARRVGQQVWGLRSARRFFSDAHWREPLRWNVVAAEEGRRARVFCASMGDVFENRADLDLWRHRLWRLIDKTPWLDWLLLTKRPEMIAHLVSWRYRLTNVWLGTTVENQDCANDRLRHLLRHKVAIRFLSCEPLLGPVDLSPWFNRRSLQPIDWVIAGGESGPGARPMNPAWPRQLRDQCEVAGIPFHFKQWGGVRKHLSGRILDGRTHDESPCPEVVR